MNKMGPVFDADFEAFLDTLPPRGGTRVRIINCLWRADITSFDKLVSKADFELLGLPHMGRASIQILAAALAERGLCLARNTLMVPYRRCPTCGQISRHLADAADE
jgi:hypothetical protein